MWKWCKSELPRKSNGSCMERKIREGRKRCIFWKFFSYWDTQCSLPSLCSRDVYAYGWQFPDTNMQPSLDMSGLRLPVPVENCDKPPGSRDFCSWIIKMENWSLETMFLITYNWEEGVRIWCLTIDHPLHTDWRTSQDSEILKAFFITVVLKFFHKLNFLLNW